ncbi:MAG: hypothetical protein ABJZ55_21475 [Fuerstiella sp.]
MSRASLVVCTLLCLFAFDAACGQAQPATTNRHTLTVWADGEWATVEGQIRDIKGSSLLFEPAGELSVKAMPFSSIRSIWFTSDPDFARGVSSFGTKNYRAAQRHFDKALQSEGRDWAKLEMMNWMARAMIADNRRAESIPLFQQIQKMDPDSRLLADLPLVWDERLPEIERLKLSPRGLTTADEISRLAIASCVLHDPEFQLRATNALKKLRATSKSSVVSQLAAAQLWRLSLWDTTETVQMLTDVWEEQWRRMPAMVRAGPGHVLGRCLQQQNEFDGAALVLLWSPFVRVNDRAIAASSLKLASQCLASAGRQADSESVFRELIQGFSGQSAAK